MDTPQGTFYRKSSIRQFHTRTEVANSANTGVYFDILLALDGSEFNAELVCQGEVMGRCTARFR